MPSDIAQLLAIPGFPEAFSIELSPALALLRERTLALQGEPQPGIPDLELSDARVWASRGEGEDWQVWRARRTAGRLGSMPIEVEAGERIVGRPYFRDPTPEEAVGLEAARAVLVSVPPFPGGDSGHFHPDYPKLFRLGIGGLLDEVAERGRATDLDGDQRAFYESCRIALEGLSTWVRRVGEACEALDGAPSERSLICRRIASVPPATFREALELMHLTLVALWFSEDHGLTTPGRMDQTLRPFYEADLAAGRLTTREAFELICESFIQLNRICWPGLAVSVLVGGRDREGRDATNDLTYLCLAARLATRLVYPTVGVVWHSETPGDLMDFSMQMLATGIGDPAFFNDDVIARGLREHGVTSADSHDYMNSTCVEIKVCGASNIWVTSPYINCPQGLLEALAEAPGASPPATFAAFEQCVRERLALAIRRASEQNDAVWRERERHGCFPLASCLTGDCLARGRDIDRGGARYNWVENSFVGLANLVDSLLAVEWLVYGEGALSLEDLYRILQEDFADHEPLRRRMLNAAERYGNDQAHADAAALRWAEFLIDTTEANIAGLHRFVPGFFCWIMHGVMGAETGATPDGRRAGEPLADGAGASQGRERRGPTASVLSTTAWPHVRALGGVVHNAKFSDTLFASSADRRALRHVVETYLRRGGFEIQVNVVGAETLRDAQRHPERHADLVVRVAGYSDYFVHLDERMQNEVISRTEFATT